ncbi:hypothetical protein M758_12G014900 [Ceratodon purpureus]|nr:hypothetical protein M758_12G014900 [Ceratodon purpureus]KAG0597695.1 hypothetical protein M758_12G014900 [Ceratodon purpureus]
MELRAAVQSLSFKSSFGWCDVRNAEVGRDSPCRVHFPVCVRSVAELTPKELHHKRKKEEWKRLRKARRMEKLAEQAREQAKGQERKQARRREGLCSFEKYKLAKERGDLEVVEWKSGVQGKSTLMSKFEEEFAMRVKEAVSSIKPVTTSDGEDSENSTRFREDSHSVFGGETEDGSDDWLLSYGRRSNDDGIHFERIADDGNIREAPSGSNLSMEDDNSRSIRDDVQRDKGTVDRVVVGDARPQHDNLELRSESGTGEVESTFSDQDERVDENSTMNTSSRSEYRFIDHSFTDEVPMGRMRASTGMYNNGVGMHRRDEADAGTASDRSSGQEDLGTLYPRDWRVNPKTPRQKDRLVARQIIDRRKGEPLSTLLDANLGDITPGNYGILDALHEDVTSEVWRKPVDEREQLEWLVQELLQAGQKQKFFLSRLMHGARLKWTDGRLLELVKMLGARREWRRAMEVVHWVHCREHFSHCRSRYVCTTLLAVLGKCLRPVEALNVFNVMREEHSTYPDMAAYHSIAVTLGKAGHLTQLLHLIESLREGPVKKDVRGSPRQLNWNGRLEPDIVVYNAVINACGPHRQWEGTEWVLQQLQSSGIRPNSTTYGLAIEVMVKSGQYAKAWKYYEIMERGDFLPNALTFKALVEALGTTGEVDKAIEMVEEMEHRGILENAGVYYALASALCAAGRLSEALVQVDKLLKIPSRKPDVVTFTGLIRTCEKVGRWQDAISLFNRMQYVCAPNVGTYNIMIALYGRHRMFEEARDMFELVKKGKHKNSKFSQSNSRLSPTEYTYESMLGACAACEDWGYFEVVLEEFNTRGFQLDCRRHAWFISPIVKAGQVLPVHLMINFAGLDEFDI